MTFIGINVTIPFSMKIFIRNKVFVYKQNANHGLFCIIFGQNRLAQMEEKIGLIKPTFKSLGPFTPLKNHKNIGFSSNTGPDPLKIAKLPSQHSM